MECSKHSRAVSFLAFSRRVSYEHINLHYLWNHEVGSTKKLNYIKIFRKNDPQINPSICLPAMLSGALFGTGEILFFVANHHLSQVSGKQTSK